MFLKQQNIVLNVIFSQFEIRHVMRHSKNIITPLSSILVYCILRTRKHYFILRSLLHDIAKTLIPAVITTM